MTDLIFATTHFAGRYTYEDQDNYHYPTDWEQNFHWTGREDYLAWVGLWKVRLKQLIAAIRAEKVIRRTAEQEYDRNQANIERQALRIDCHNLLLLRRLGKLHAGRQRAQHTIAA